MSGSGDAGEHDLRPMGNRRNGNGRMSPQSPLENFGQAKKHIYQIFEDIMEYVCNVKAYVDDIESSSHIEGVKCSEQVNEYKEKVIRIKNVLAQDRMKVVFFGRTSNGKSTTVNAMLRDKVLPAGIGHTTDCFLQVEGSESKDGYLLTEEEPGRQQCVQSAEQLASALSNAKLKQSSQIRILWPTEKCRLLREGVVLVDSPGVNVTPDLDMWIDKYCMDADVFVLVSNAEATIMDIEKNFFHKVSAKLSKPNIFILQNRWDISDIADNVEKVKQQHLDRSLQFLCDELKVMDRTQGQDRVFFVSSLEVLAQRMEESGTPARDGIFQEKFQERALEFANFERQFEECISNSALRTKVEHHTDGGKAIVSELKQIMEEKYRTSLREKELTVKLRGEFADTLDKMKKHLVSLNQAAKDKTKSIVAAVNENVLSRPMVSTDQH